MWGILYLLPKNQISYFFGKLTKLRRPKIIVQFCIDLFIKAYSLNLEEAARKREDFSSLAELFTRELKPEARSISTGVLSPADGKVSAFGRIEGEKIFQIKGRHYELSKLLGHDLFAERFIDGFFTTIYLAPSDYHRVHSPVAGEIVSMRYIPGKLWPVNSWSVMQIDGLFTQNERIITFIKTKEFGLVAVVKVGATNVGSISLAYDNFKSNQSFFRFSAALSEERRYQSLSIEKGEHLATFELGSTVILLFEKERFKIGDSCLLGKPIKFGESIGA